MNAFEALTQAEALIALGRQAAHVNGQEAEEQLWLYLRTLCHFIRVTGQVYRFEDALAAATPGEPLRLSAHLGLQEGSFAQRAAELLLHRVHTPAEPQQPIRLLITLLHFLSETGQLGDAEDFFLHHLEDAPMAIAQFRSLEEAAGWLKGVADPPSPAYILIGDEYYQFWYRREDQTRGLYRDYPIAAELEALTAGGIPPHTPSFATRPEAEDWLKNHPAQPYTFVSIAGEHYLAVNHRRLKRHSLHHVASALKLWKEHKQALERESGSAPEEPPFNLQ